MKEITITGDGYAGYYKYERQTSRGLMVRGDEILMSYEEGNDIWEIPGGGLEDGEDHIECCAREVLEETGMIVNVGEHVLTVTEYYDEARMIHRYFICDIIGKGEMNPTEYERKVNAHPVWIKFEELLPILKNGADADEKTNDNHRIYLRGYTALKEYLKMKINNQKEINNERI